MFLKEKVIYLREKREGTAEVDKILFRKGKHIEG